KRGHVAAFHFAGQPQFSCDVAKCGKGNVGVGLQVSDLHVEHAKLSLKPFGARGPECLKSTPILDEHRRASADCHLLNACRLRDVTCRRAQHLGPAKRRLDAHCTSSFVRECLVTLWRVLEFKAIEKRQWYRVQGDSLPPPMRQERG